MTYKETIDFLFSQLAMYQSQGPSAYKPGLGNTLALDNAFGSPSRRLKAIHIAGTNGKGSTSHLIAAALQAAGYKTGLFTSPHLLDFRERIRINGAMIREEEVTGFVERYMQLDLGDIRPSFFELTTIMAFDWFVREEVDIAVIETGLGGRLDSTNILTPLLSVITNISLDHTALLGNTLEEIASEKAGIIKLGIPAIVGEASGKVRNVFERKAAGENAPITFANDCLPYGKAIFHDDRVEYTDTPFGTLCCDLTGSYQAANMATVLTALATLRDRNLLFISDDAVKSGLADVTGSTGLMGRWMTVGRNPLTVCDTGHNIGGWEYLAPRLAAIPGHKEIVLGFVNDKEIAPVLRLAATIPDATFRFTQASVNRALAASELASRARECGIDGTAYPSVAQAYAAACEAARADDTIFVGGSTFIVADLLAFLQSIDRPE